MFDICRFLIIAISLLCDFSTLSWLSLNWHKTNRWLCKMKSKYSSKAQHHINVLFHFIQSRSKLYRTIQSLWDVHSMELGCVIMSWSNMKFCGEKKIKWCSQFSNTISNDLANIAAECLWWPLKYKSNPLGISALCEHWILI